MENTKELEYVKSTLKGYRAWMVVHGGTVDEFERDIAHILDELRESVNDGHL